jgi:molecular chaperone DnaK
VINCQQIKKTPIENALAELKKAYESKDLAQIDTAMEKINEAWKAASEEMYKAEQAGQQQAQGAPTGEAGNAEPKNEGDNVEDVDFEEVKED